MKTSIIPVVDLFAGPGGLGEGFSSLNGQFVKSPFKIVLSVEKDEWAHKTLSLRAFFRQFVSNGQKVPEEYYQHIQNPDSFNRQMLWKVFPKQATAADDEAIRFELGKDDGSCLQQKISQAIGQTNEWLLIGGPPCQAYSLAGRSRNAGNAEYVAEKDHRHFLYKEYLKIIADHWPSVFVMENVKGILSSKINDSSIFQKIIKDLKDPGKAVDGQKKFKYHLLSFVAEEKIISEESTSFTVRSEEYGIPQARHRVIIMGVRNDIIEKNGFPQHLKKVETLPLDEFICLPNLRSAISSRVKIKDTFDNWLSLIRDALNQKWIEQCDNKVKECVFNTIESLISCDKIEPIQARSANKPRKYGDWFFDQNLKKVLNHEARSHRNDDLHRYLFAACYAKIHGKSPQLKDFPEALIPNHRSATENGVENASFADRFRVQCYGKPSTTITCHISKDGHYYIHPDPTQCRSFTVREVARLQTFPDNYFFCGPRTEQFKQVGNAVPPLLAKQLAEIVFKLLRQ